MIDMISECVSKHNDYELVSYLEKHARELLKGFNMVIDGNKEPETLLVLYGKVETMASLLKVLNKRNQERQAQANMV